MGIPIKDIATPNAFPAWDPEVGEVVGGEIRLVKLMPPKLNFNKTANEQEMRIDLMQPNGEGVTIWAVVDTNVDSDDGYPSRLARAIAQAVREAGEDEIEHGPGSWLGVARIGDGEPPQPGFSAPKNYQAEYTPPKRTTGVSMAAMGQPTAVAPSVPQPPAAVPPAPSNPFAGLMGQPVAPAMPKVQPTHLAALAAAFGVTPDAVAEWPPTQMAQALVARGLSAPDMLQMLTVAYGVDDATAAPWVDGSAQPAPAANPLQSLLGRPSA